MPTRMQLVDGAIKAGSKLAWPRIASRAEITSFVPDSWSANSFTAPCDGTLVAFVYGTRELYLSVISSAFFVSGSSFGANANYLTASVPLRKGDTCSAFFAKPTGDVHFNFWPSQGSS